MVILEIREFAQRMSGAGNGYSLVISCTYVLSRSWADGTTYLSSVLFPGPLSAPSTPGRNGSKWPPLQLGKVGSQAAWRRSSGTLRHDWAQASIR